MKNNVIRTDTKMAKAKSVFFSQVFLTIYLVEGAMSVCLSATFDLFEALCGHFAKLSSEKKETPATHSDDLHSFVSSSGTLTSRKTLMGRVFFMPAVVTNNSESASVRIYFSSSKGYS